MFIKFFAIPAFERRFFLESISDSFVAFLLVTFIPIRKFEKKLGKRWEESTLDSKPMDFFQIKQVMVAIRRCKKYVPWPMRCFAEAITAKKMLDRRGISSTLYLGLSKKDDRQLIAHAWLRSGNIIVTGGNHIQHYTTVMFFS
jgi:hypothetical protein